MDTQLQTAIQKRTIEIQPVSLPNQMLASLRLKADGLVTTLFMNTNHRRVSHIERR